MLLNVTRNRFNSLRPSDAYICVGNLTIVGSDNGLSPGRRQAIIWTNDGILLMRPLGTNFSEISSEILILSFKKMRLKMSSAKWRQFSLALNVLNNVSVHWLAIHKTLHNTWYATLTSDSRFRSMFDCRCMLDFPSTPIMSIADWKEWQKVQSNWTCRGKSIKSTFMLIFQFVRFPDDIQWSSGVRSIPLVVGHHTPFGYPSELDAYSQELWDILRLIFLNPPNTRV